MTTLAIAIVAHPKRAKRAAELADELDAHVVMDDAEYGDAINHARAWEWLAGQDTDWSVAVEDDAIPAKRFRERMVECIEALPHDGLLLGYTGSDSRTSIGRRTTDAHIRAEQLGRTHITLRSAHWGVTIAARTTHAPAIAQALRSSRAPSDDTIGYWAQRHPLHIYATHPNLADHEDGDSVLGHGKRGPRRALWFRG